jgi:hypothetical protein
MNNTKYTVICEVGTEDEEIVEHCAYNTTQHNQMVDCFLLQSLW